jgi:hypothetical protein
MLISTLLLARLLLPDTLGTDPARVFSGRERQLSVHVPRIEAEVKVDGQLDEPAWAQATMLTGFSQYAPTDGLPASDSTQVLVWYSPTAIYFGIRAYEAHGSATATLAGRDQIFNDDNIQILLGTFHDGRQAMMFAVNPLGVQGDGALLEGRNTGSSLVFGGAVQGREQADLSTDYVFQSKGRVTPWGYEVEVRIPFKSLRFQPAPEQSWNINVIREVKHSGFEDSWAPALRAAPSFLNQSGEIVGLAGLRRGLVMELNPEATERVTGAPGTVSGYDYTRGNPQIGGNVRWGISNSLALNGTVHPDFSQVESDAGQLAFDPRQALFFAEKRPFFLEGGELFSVPSNLIYTRRIVQPVAAAKLSGNIAGTDVGVLSAVDDQINSVSGSDNPIFNILRLQRRISSHARIGIVYTDEEDAGNSSRVAAVDGRVSSGVFSFNYQMAGARTHTDSSTVTAPLWATSVNAQGHHAGLAAGFSGISDQFYTASGFISRNGIVHSYLDPSWTLFGKRGAFIERFTGDILYDGIWQYQNFIHGRHRQDEKLHFNGAASLHGGWNAGLGVFIESFGYDSSLFANYRIEVPKSGGGLDTIPFTGRYTIPNAEWLFQLNTPQWQHFTGGGYYLQGHDENFFEWQSARLRLLQFDVTWRPTDRIRAEASYFWQQVARRTDGSIVDVGRIPRLKLEYQVSRPFFVRLVGQYVQNRTDSLRDDGRTNGTILIPDGNGVLQRSTPSSTNLFHVDVLLSYQPVPGTVILAGYGSDMLDAGEFGFRNLTRADDAFFMKLSWLFRL